MTYFLRYSPHATTLVECTQREAADHTKADVSFDRVDATFARSWVKDGYHHETPLYVEDGRVRYASDPDAERKPRRRRVRAKLVPVERNVWTNHARDARYGA